MPIITVNEIPQWGDGADRYRTDCGAAAIAMLLALYKLLGSLTVNQLAAETTLAQKDNGLRPEQLCTLAAAHGLQCHVNTFTTVEQLQAEVDAGRPSIPLIANRDIPNRLDQRDKTPGLDGHFFVVIGYEAGYFIVNDPDVWKPNVAVGTKMHVAFSDMDKALGDTNNSRQAVFVNPSQVHPIYTGMKVVNVNALNARFAPGIAGKVLGQLLRGQEVEVVNGDEAWSEIKLPLYVSTKLLK